MIVIDASALAAYVLREEGFEEVSEYLRRYRTISIDLVAKEVANAIIVALKRGRIDARSAERAFKALLIMLNTIIELYPQRELLEDAFSIATSMGLTIYDSLYIALAKRMQALLLTKDRKQYEAAKTMNITARLIGME